VKFAMGSRSRSGKWKVQVDVWEAKKVEGYGYRYRYGDGMAWDVSAFANAHGEWFRLFPVIFILTSHATPFPCLHACAFPSRLVFFSGRHSSWVGR